MTVGAADGETERTMVQDHEEGRGENKGIYSVHEVCVKSKLQMNR